MSLSKAVGWNLKVRPRRSSALGAVVRAFSSTETTVSPGNHSFLMHRPIMNIFEQRGRSVANGFVAPNASVVGDVKMMDHSCIWYGAVVRADKNAVKIGAHVSVGDKTVINTVGRVDTGFSSSVDVGSWTLIEPGAVLTSCSIGDRCHIGAGAVVSEGSVVEGGGRIGAGTVIPPGQLVPGNELWAGNPAKFVRKLSDEDVKAMEEKAVLASVVGKVHGNEFNPYGQAYLDAESRQ